MGEVRGGDSACLAHSLCSHFSLGLHSPPCWTSTPVGPCSASTLPLLPRVGSPPPVFLLLTLPSGPCWVCGLPTYQPPLSSPVLLREPDWGRLRATEQQWWDGIRILKQPVLGQAFHSGANAWQSSIHSLAGSAWLARDAKLGPRQHTPPPRQWRHVTAAFTRRVCGTQPPDSVVLPLACPCPWVPHPALLSLVKPP